MKNNTTRKTINVDTPNLMPLWTFKEADNVILKLSLFKDAVAFNITGQTIRLGAKTNAGLKEQIDGFTIQGNNLDIALKNTILVPGIIEIDLEFTDVGGKMTSTSFFINVSSKVLNGTAVQATDEFDTFTKTVEEITTDYKSLRKIVIAENAAADLQDQVNTTNAQLEHNAKKIKGRISILDYEHLVINKGKENEDWKNAFQKARDDLANATIKHQLIFPQGIYQYSVSPNWAISKAQIVAEGEVRLRYTGTEDAVIIDAGAVTGLCWDMKFGKFLIECPSTAKNACFVRGVHASHIEIKALGAGTNYAGIRVEWSVCTDFYITVSNNHEGWYKGAKPLYGIFIDKKELQPEGQGGYTSWCSFYTPKIEGCEFGIYIIRGQGNSFYSGTSEGNSKKGIILESTAIYNKFYSIDMEANTEHDIYCVGRENEFYSVDSTGIHLFDGYARDNVMIGGSQNQITLAPTTYGNVFQNIKYNRFNNGSTMNDISGRNRLVNNRNVGLNRSENRPPSSSAITVGTSPFTYVNESGNDELINMFGGTISQFGYFHGGYGDTASTIPQFIRLCPGDSIKITYSVAPTMRKYTT